MLMFKLSRGHGEQVAFLPQEQEGEESPASLRQPSQSPVSPGPLGTPAFQSIEASLFHERTEGKAQTQNPRLGPWRGL